VLLADQSIAVLPAASRRLGMTAGIAEPAALARGTRRTPAVIVVVTTA
jgi:hypothetical protein